MTNDTRTPLERALAQAEVALVGESTAARSDALYALASAVRSELFPAPGSAQAGNLRSWTREDLMATVRNAGELWNSTGGDDPYDVLGSVQRQRLDRAGASYLAAEE